MNLFCCVPEEVNHSKFEKRDVKRVETTVFDDILIEIFSYLTFEDIYNIICKVSMKWNQICWKSIQKYVFNQRMNKNLVIRNQRIFLKKKCSNIKTITCSNSNLVSNLIGMLSIELKNLQILKLSTQIEVEDLSEFKTLKTLKYVQSQITKDHLNCLASFIKLEKLSLDSPYLSRIEKDHFSFLSKLSNLKKLKLSQVKIGFVTEFITSLKLESLIFIKSSPNDDCLKQIHEIKTLKKLILDSCSLLDDKELSNIFTITQLEDLRILYIPLLTDVSFKCISSLIHLKTLHVKVAKDITDVSIHSINNLVNLENLIIEYTSITDKGVKSLTNLKNLKNLNLVGSSKITDEIFNLIPNSVEKMEIGYCTSLKLKDFQPKDFPKLTDISLFWDRKLDNETLKNLSKLNLKYLDLGQCISISSNFDQISNLVNLEVLNLSNLQIQDKDIAGLKYLLKLKDLKLGGTPITGETFPSLPSLKKLNLERCLQLSVNGMNTICLNTSLEELYLMNNMNLKSKIENLEKLKELTHLQMRNLAEFPHEAFESISKLSNLKELCLIHCKLISNDTLKFFSGLMKLEELDLTECSRKIDEKGLKQLSKIPNLQKITLLKSKINITNIQKILKYTKINIENKF